MTQRTNEHGTLVFEMHRIPPFPAVYSKTVAIEPLAISEAKDPTAFIVTVIDHLLRNAQQTDKLLGRRGLNWKTLRLIYVPPTSGDPNTLISWKAARR
jgi:hypothetical protein